jgi:hypothetical protein
MAPVDFRAMDRIHIMHCTSASELLNHLSPRSPLWRTAPPTDWIFRGQDGDYPLLPKAFRDQGNCYRDLGIHVERKPTREELIAAGHEFLRMFRAKLDESGLAIPVDVPNPFQDVSINIDMSEEADLKLQAQLALAQHLGLPTPLLDWSTRANVAAYFAAPKEQPPKHDRLVIWALRRSLLKVQHGHQLYRSARASLVLRTAPRSSNPNLHAQSGVFTRMLGEWGPELDVAEYVEEVEPNPDSLVKTPLPGFPLMHKLTLPTKLGGTLLQLLQQEGIDGSTMFPGYDGIARALREDGAWNRAYY